MAEITLRILISPLTLLLLLLPTMGCPGGAGDAPASEHNLTLVDLLPDSAVPAVTIGLAEGDDEFIFGRIWDVTDAPNGGLIVLDRQALDLRWFDSFGQLMGRVGRAGSGPGEFRAPYDLEVVFPDTVLVLDGPLRRLSAFLLDSDGLILVQEYPVDLSADQFCSTDAGFLFHAVDIGRNASFFAVDADLEITRYFGELLHEVSPEVEQAGRSAHKAQNLGRNWCDPATGVIFLLHQNIPYLRAFSPEGKELWRRRLSDAFGMYPTLLDGGFMIHGSESETGEIDEGRAVFPWGPDTLAIALERMPFPMTTETTFELRLVQASTGIELARYKAPMVITGSDEEYFLGYVNHPFPQVLKYRRSSG